MQPEDDGDGDGDGEFDEFVDDVADYVDDDDW